MPTRRKSRSSRSSRRGPKRHGDLVSKTQIENAGLSGLPVTFGDVARVSRKHRGVVTLRHVWPENVDARIWSAVRRAAIRGAQEMADRIGRAVEVYNVHGNVIAQIEPSRD